MKPKLLFPTPCMGRKPSCRVNFMLRVDKDLLLELREIAKVQNVSISDLIERKILELIKEFDSEKGKSRMRNSTYEISNENKISKLSNRKSSHSKNRESNVCRSKISKCHESWTGGDLNPRPPPCQDGALPAELPALSCVAS